MHNKKTAIPIFVLPANCIRRFTYVYTHVITSLPTYVELIAIAVVVTKLEIDALQSDVGSRFRMLNCKFPLYSSYSLMLLLFLAVCIMPLEI